MSNETYTAKDLARLKMNVDSLGYVSKANDKKWMLILGIISIVLGIILCAAGGGLGIFFGILFIAGGIALFILRSIKKTKLSDLRYSIKKYNEFWANDLVELMKDQYSLKDSDMDCKPFAFSGFNLDKADRVRVGFDTVACNCCQTTVMIAANEKLYVATLSFSTDDDAYTIDGAQVFEKSSIKRLSTSTDTVTVKDDKGEDVERSVSSYVLLTMDGNYQFPYDYTLCASEGSDSEINAAVK